MDFLKRSQGINKNKMNKTIIIISIITLIFIVGLYSKNEGSLGNILVNENAYSSASYTSSTITNSIATSVLSKATSSRTMAKICLLTGGTTFLYKQATSTGVVVNQGDPIYATSTPKSCAVYDDNDPYFGQVWAISDVTSTLVIEYKQE